MSVLPCMYVNTQLNVLHLHMLNVMCVPVALKWDKFSFMAHSMGKDCSFQPFCVCHTDPPQHYRYRNIFMGKSNTHVPHVLCVLVVLVLCSSARDG